MKVNSVKVGVKMVANKYKQNKKTGNISFGTPFIRKAEKKK